MSLLGNHTRIVIALAATALCLPFGGCATYHAQAGGGFSHAALADAGAKNGIPFQVDGKVGGVQGAPLASAVGAAMPASVGGAAVHYLACDPYTECAGDHLVWTFGPPAARPRSAYPPAMAVNLNLIGSYQPSPNNVSAKLAYIQGGNVVASVAGQVDAADPNDPGFKAMIDQMSGSVLSGPDILDWIGFP